MQASSIPFSDLEITVEPSKLCPVFEPGDPLPGRWPRSLRWLRSGLFWIVAPWLKAQRLQHALDHDYVSGAKSRLYLDSVLSRELARFARDDRDRVARGLVLGIVDIDHFKRLNDQGGHDAGDRALIAVAQYGRWILRRDTDVFARHGGDEFAFLLPQTSLRAGYFIANGLRSALHEAGLPVSIGLAQAARGSTPESLRKAADDALYLAKRTRNTVYVAGTL